MAKPKIRTAGKKNKYNWTILKLEFFKSDFVAARPFIESKGVQYNRHTADKIKGWADEKADMVNDIVNKQLEKEKEKLEMPVVDLMKAKKYILSALARKAEIGGFFKFIDQNGKKQKVWVPKMDAEELKKWYEMVKTELGEPAKILHNFNDDTKPIPKTLSTERIAEIEKDATDSS